VRATLIDETTDLMPAWHRDLLRASTLVVRRQTNMDET
jgi:hypothetical protein